MIKLLLSLSLLLLSTCVHAEYKAKQVTEENLKDLRSIDIKLYNLASHVEKYNYEEISRFIYNNLVYDLDFTRFKVTGTASIRKTKYITANPITNRGDMARAQLLVSYPFFDAKESNDRLAKMMTVKQKIISEVKKYFTLKSKLAELKIERLITLRIETRVKARKLQATGSFDEWLKVIKDLKKVNFDLTQSEIELSESLQILLSYVHVNKQKLLRNML